MEKPLAYEKPSGRVEVIDQMIRRKCKYRYRLKPLELIRITRAINDKIIKYCPTADMLPFKNHDGTILLQIDGREVEIID